MSGSGHARERRAGRRRWRRGTSVAAARRGRVPAPALAAPPGMLAPAALLIALLAALLPAGGCGRGGSGGGEGGDEIRIAVDPARAPNVVVYLIDALRRDHLGCYGYPRPTSPALDRLAREGGPLADYRVPTSWTKPSVATLFTGLHPLLHGCQDRSDRLWPGWLTLPEVFAQAGYATLAVVANPVVHPDFGYAQGFGAFRDASDMTTHTGSSSENVNRMFLEELDALAAAGGPRRPFFAYLHTMDPHAPYTPRRRYLEAFLAGGDGNVLPRGEPAERTPEEAGRQRELTKKLRQPADGQPDAADETRREQRRLLRLGIMDGRRSRNPTPDYIAGLVDLYDAEIRQNDDQLGILIETLQQRGLWENTVLIVLSDHGEGFYAHGLFGHGNSLHAELTRVPCVAHWPAGAAGRAGREWWDAARRRPVHAMELAAALPVLTGLARRSPLTVNAAWAERHAPGPGAAAADLDAVGSLTMTAYRWLGWEEGDRRSLFAYRPERLRLLYDLRRDPGEAAPLAEPASLAASQAALERVLARWLPGLVVAARHAAVGETLRVTAAGPLRDWAPLGWEGEAPPFPVAETGGLRWDLAAAAPGDLDAVILVPQEGSEAEFSLTVERRGRGAGEAPRVLAAAGAAAPAGENGRGRAAPREEWELPGGPWDPARAAAAPTLALNVAAAGAAARLRLAAAGAFAGPGRGPGRDEAAGEAADEAARQLCAALGLPVPPAGAVAAGWRASPLSWRAGDASPLTPAAAAKLEQQMKALGYVQ